ncbi:MAG TPA: BON domain-containing protein [Bryobacteraceae bacterium]|nr:BON domain-containing protein [Bryobacteraceae bacterium]
MKLKRAASSLLLALGLTFTALAADKPVSDDFLTDTIRSRLAADAIVKGGALDVEVHEGAVVLKGKVDEEKQRQRAEKIVKGIKGVKSVKSELQLAHP